MIYRLTRHNSIANQFLSELRDSNIQTDQMRFRKNLERLGQIFAYEISKHLDYEEKSVQTVLGIANANIPTEKIVLTTILRAGLPLHHGLLSFFDQADSAFVSAYRKHNPDGTFEISLQYKTCPSIEGAVLIISDPMLATGASLHQVIKAMREYGTPKAIHLVCVIAATEGVNYIHNLYPDAHIWIGAEDPVLNPKSYIVPGLGDAGDLAFGEKLQS